MDRKEFKGILKEINYYNNGNYIINFINECLLKHISIEESLISLLENYEIENNCTFPNSKNIVTNIINYCLNYIDNNKPNNNEYGTYYYFIINNDIAKINFCDELECIIYLPIEQKINITNNGYKRIDNFQDIKYINDNKKIKTIKINIKGKINNKKLDINDLYSCLMHELLHAYEDYCRILKHNKTLDNYINSTNYNDYFSLKTITSSKYELYLCNLFHFFNKSEIRALVSEFVGEIEQMDLFSNHNFYDIIKNTNTWKEIQDVGKVIELIKYSDKSLHKNLIETYQKHSVKKQKISFNKMINILEKHYFYITQMLSSKFSKILYKEYIKQKKQWNK